MEGFKQEDGEAIDVFLREQSFYCCREQTRREIRREDMRSKPDRVVLHSPKVGSMVLRL